MRKARTTALFLTLFGATALLPAAASAQTTGASFWYGASVGAGSARFTCDACATGRDGGPEVHLALGAWARPGVRVGVSGGYWTHDAEELRETVRHAGLVGALDVRPGSRLHVIAGLGWIGWRSEPFTYDAVDVSVGAGFELPLIGRWALSNTALLHSASYGRLRRRGEDDAAVPDVSLSLAGFEVGVVRR